MSDKIVTVTDRARNKAVSVRDAEPDAEKLVLFLEVGEQPNGFEFSYDLYLDDRANIRDGDVVQDEDGITIVVPAASVDNITGAKLDLSKDLLNPGWIVDNPNSPSPAVGQRLDPGELTGTVEERIQIVLDRVINPSIASHGGRADLDHVADGVAHLRLSGGCQGCGMAKVTLSQGIEVALRDAIPEIVGVSDVTDHESGENPYFAGAKK